MVRTLDWPANPASTIKMEEQEKSVLTQKRRRGPKPTGKGQTIGVRIHPPLLAALDAFIDAQPDPKPSRPEAIRQILKERLEDAP